MTTENKSRLLIGVIADDFTGAGDAASYLTSAGLRTSLVIVPHMDEIDLNGCDALVVALKSRSQPAEDAVRDCLDAARWLCAAGAEKLYFKYCSTFDSTPQGNIGPVCDAILNELDLPYTILCPSLLENGRMVKDGVLYVNGVPLAESHMKNHPLNPMWDSRVAALMERQSKYPAFVLRRAEYDSRAALARKIEALKSQNERFYLVPDYFEPCDGAFLADFFGGLSFWTGGSELLAHFARRCAPKQAGARRSEASTRSKRLGRVMLCGSCSDMTMRQVDRWIRSGGRAQMITLDDAAAGEVRAQELAALYLTCPDEDILFYSSGSAGLRSVGGSDASASGCMERLVARLAVLITAGTPVDRLIVAGGETSGAVTLALGLHAFSIGESVAPGIPVLLPEGTELRLVLKSGNFGNEDFFLRALED